MPDEKKLKQELADVRQELSVVKVRMSEPKLGQVTVVSEQPGESRLNVFAQFTEEEYVRSPENFMLTWKTGVFDNISIEFYNSEEMVYFKDIDLRENHYSIIATGALDAQGNVQPKGAYLGESVVGGSHKDFVGEVHIPGHGRSMHFNTPEDCNVENGFMTLQTELDDCYWRVEQCFRYYRTLVVKVFNRSEGLKKSGWQKWKAFKMAEWKITSFILTVTGLRMNNGDIELQIPEAVSESRRLRLLDLVKKRFIEKDYLNDGKLLSIALP